MITLRNRDSGEKSHRPRVACMVYALFFLGFRPVLDTQPAHGQDAMSPIASVESLIRAGQYDKAAESSQTQLHLKPNDYRMWTLQGIALSLEGRTTDAIGSFDKALHLSPEYGPALKGEVQLLFSAGDKRAIPLLQRILKADPDDATAHEMLATLYRKEEDCVKAIEHFAAISQAIEKHPAALAAEGYCFVQLRRYDVAAPVFEKLATLLPDQDYPKYDLAVVFVLAKQYQAALDALSPLLTANQRDSDVLNLGSEANEALGKTPQAVSLLRQAIVLNPAVPDYYVSFAEICLDHDSFQAGVDMMTVGLNHVPNSPQIYLSRGLLHAQLAEYDAAEADFRKSEQLDSAQSLTSYAIDLSEMQRNNPDQALLQVQSQLKTHPESPLLNYLLAKLLMIQSPAADSAPFKRAMNSLQHAIKLKPDLADAHDLLADIYMAEGQYEMAIEQSRIALQYVPTDETAAYHLVIALRHAGHKDELPALVKRLSQLHQDALKKETDRKRFRLELANSP
jgi:tetratricopeptide (TPR) repeat protein